MDDKITIIEGPPPTFDEVQDGWALGLSESPYLFDLSVTRLRTFNGPALVERCHRAWRKGVPIVLEYRNRMGMALQAPIMAARSMEIEGNQILLLWVRRELEDAKAEMDGQSDDNAASGNQ